MANLRTTYCGIEIKNPIGVSSCDFGSTAAHAKRACEQGIGWITSKTAHHIDGPHHWPRPFFYSLKKFGPEMKDCWICSQQFLEKDYDKWLNEELPKILKVCAEHDVLFVGSVCGIGEDPATWECLLKDHENAGVKVCELDTGGPHATFGAEADQADVGAPLAMDPKMAGRIAKMTAELTKMPLLYKMTPQCVHQASVSAAVAPYQGIVANNAFYGTWIDHETGEFFGIPASMGGLIGRPWQLFSLAKFLETTCTVPKTTQICGIGGIFTWDDCVRYLLAGATVTGLCSAVYSRGVTVLKDCIDGLNAYMDRKGYNSIEDFRGISCEKFGYLRDWPRENHMADLTPIVPHFENKNCTKCGICEKVCPYGAITVDENGARVNREDCMGCGWCMGHCPAKNQVIKMYNEDTGEMVWDLHNPCKPWALGLEDHVGGVRREAGSCMT